MASAYPAICGIQREMKNIFFRRLYLQDNQITEVGVGTFSAVTRIGTIDLARNKITKVHYQMFQQVKYAEVSMEVPGWIFV